MPSMRRFAALVVLVLAVPAPASAAKSRASQGEPRYSQGFSCTSIIFNDPSLEQQTFLFASQIVPVKGLVPAGDPFYIGASFGSVGDICGGGGSLLPEFVLPRGVVRATDTGSKPYWEVFQDGGTTRGSDPVVLGKGLFGGITAAGRDKRDNEVKPWIYANSGGFITVYVPVRARRKLNGIGSTAPICTTAEENTGACPEDQSGDYLQVFGQVADGSQNRSLVPNLGLFAGPPRRPGLKARARRGRVTLTATTAPRFRVSFTVKRGKRTLLRRRVRADRSGRARLVARDLRAGRATVEASAIADDGSVSVKRAKRRVTVR